MPTYGLWMGIAKPVSNISFLSNSADPFSNDKNDMLLITTRFLNGTWMITRPIYFAGFSVFFHDTITGYFHCRRNIKRFAILAMLPKAHDRCSISAHVDTQSAKRIICHLYDRFRCICSFKFMMATGSLTYIWRHRILLLTVSSLSWHD